MSGQWHYQLFGEEFGPVSEETLRELIAQGTLMSDDPVRREGGTWTPAGKALALSSGEMDVQTATAIAGGSDFDQDTIDKDAAEEWYCQVLGQELGPLAFNDLLHFAENGELKADDQVRFGTKGKWRRVGSVGRLVAVLPYQNSSVTRVGKKTASKPAANGKDVAPAPAAPAAPRITYAPAASEAAWFAWIRGAEYGPSSLLQLQQGINSGQISATDFVKYGPTGAWCPPSTVAQMLQQYQVVAPAAPAKTVTPSTAMPTVTNVPPAASKTSSPAISTPSPAAKTETPAPAAKPEPPKPAAPEPAAKPAVTEPPKPTPSLASSSASMNTYGGSSASSWQAKTVTPPKPVSRPSSSSGGRSLDLSFLAPLMEPKNLGIGGGAIAAVALVFAFLYMPAGNGAEVRAFNELLPIYKEFQKARESKGNIGDLDAKIKKVCPPIVKELEPRASVSRPVSQKLLWIAKYRMNEMVAKGTATRSQAEIECEQMLYDVSKALNVPMDAPKPVEKAPTKSAPQKANPAMDFGT